MFYKIFKYFMDNDKKIYSKNDIIKVITELENKIDNHERVSGKFIPRFIIDFLKRKLL